MNRGPSSAFSPASTSASTTSTSASNANANSIDESVVVAAASSSTPTAASERLQEVASAHSQSLQQPQFGYATRMSLPANHKPAASAAGQVSVAPPAALAAAHESNSVAYVSPIVPQANEAS